jgi:hypothetical protein
MLRNILYAGMLLWVCHLAAVVSAQGPVHYLNRADMPPGQIGRAQLERGGPLAGYFQPVDVRGPQGALVSLAMEGDFPPTESNKVLSGLLIGQVYRLRVGNIPRLADVEIFPSIEVIDRLYPPPGQETRFPIPIEISHEDLELASQGKYITRVIYLEDPRHPLPVREIPHEQRVLDSHLSQDPLQVADQWGRPMAILRLGSRVPTQDIETGKFLFDSPPVRLFDIPSQEAPRTNGLESPAEPVEGSEQATKRFPRVPLHNVR